MSLPPTPANPGGRSYLAPGAVWGGAMERAVRTVAQAVLAIVTVDATSTAFAIDWRYTAGPALLAGVISILTSVVAAPIGPPGSPSMVNDRPAPVTDVAV